jgi:hypothetical protein
MTTPPEPYHTLDANPRQRFAEFERKVYDDAGSSCIDLLPHGLLALVVSDTIWANLPNNTTINDNVTTTIPRPTYPSPIQPTDNATAGVWKAFETRRKHFDSYNAASLLILRRLKVSLPPADIALLSHPILGLANTTSLEIMNHLRRQYGTFRATDFAELYLELEEKMTSTSTFVDFASRFRFIFAQFEVNNQSISQLQQCLYLSRAIAAHSDLVKAQDTYFQLFPDPRARTFAELVAHITLHAPNYVSTSADYGYTAKVEALPPMTPDSLQTFLLSPQFATIVANAATASHPTPSNSRNAPSQFLRQHKPKPSSRRYCFLHGYDWHNSQDCRNMAKDPTTYSSIQRSANSHMTCPGGSVTKM